MWTLFKYVICSLSRYIVTTLLVQIVDPRMVFKLRCRVVHYFEMPSFAALAGLLSNCVIYIRNRCAVDQLTWRRYRYGPRLQNISTVSYRVVMAKSRRWISNSQIDYKKEWLNFTLQFVTLMMCLKIYVFLHSPNRGNALPQEEKYDLCFIASTMATPMQIQRPAHPVEHEVDEPIYRTRFDATP